MKYIIVPGFVLLSFTATAFATDSLCTQKALNIQNEIKQAEAHNNQYRVDGLKKALNEVHKNCTETKLIAEHKQKIKEQQQKVDERKAELLEAEQKGKQDKITKKQQKLTEAENKLKALESNKY